MKSPRKQREETKRSNPLLPALCCPHVRRNVTALRSLIQALLEHHWTAKSAAHCGGRGHTHHKSMKSPRGRYSPYTRSNATPVSNEAPHRPAAPLRILAHSRHPRPRVRITLIGLHRQKPPGTLHSTWQRPDAGMLPSPPPVLCSRARNRNRRR